MKNKNTRGIDDMKIQEKNEKADVGGEISECREYRQIPSHHPAFFI